MADEKLLFTIGAKDSASTTISKVQKNLKFLDKQYKEASKGSKDFANSQEGMKAKLEMLSGKFEQTKIKLDAYNKKLEENKQKASEQAKKIEELKKSFNMEEAIGKSESKIKSYQEKIDKVTASMEKEKAKLEQLKASEGDNAEKIAKSEEKMAKYQARIEKLNSSMDKEKTHLEKLKSGHADNEAAVQKAEAQLDKYNQQVIKSQQDIKLTEQELKNFSREIENTNSKMQNKSVENYVSALEKSSNGIKDLGGKISSTGSKITSYGQDLSVLSAGVTAVGVAGVKAYKDVKVGMDNVIKATGATGESAKELEETYHNIGKNSAADWGAIGSALGEVNTRFGFTGEMAEKCTEQFLKFAKINNTDATQSVKLVSRAMGDAGIEADEYGNVLDMLSAAAQASGIDINKLTESLTQFGAPMRNLGFDMKDSIALFATWEKAGVNTQTAFSGLKKAISVWGKSGKDATKEFSKTVKAIKDAKTPAEASAKAIEVFGAKAGPDLADAIRGGRFNVDEMTKVLENCGGVVDATASQLADGTQETTKRLHEAQIVLSDLGKTIIVESVPFLKDMTTGVRTLAKWYNGLSDSTKQTIVKLGGFTAICGPVVMGLGKIISVSGKTITAFGSLSGGIGKLATKLGGMGKTAKTAKTAFEVISTAQTSTTASSVGLISALGGLGPAIGIIGTVAITTGTALYAMHEADKVLDSGITQSTDDMSTMAKLMADLMGVQRYSNKELEDMGFKYKSFSNDIAPETKEAVENIASKFRELKINIDKIDISNAVTEEEKNSLINKTNELCNAILGQLDSLQSEAYNKLKETFSIDGIDEQEQKILDSMDSGAKQIKDKVATTQAEIQKLYEQGALNTTEGRQQLNDKLLELQDIYAEELKAKEKANQQDIEAFESEANTLSISEASRLLKEKSEIRDKEIEDTKNTYDEAIALLKEQVSRCSEEEKPLYEAKLEELEAKKQAELESENQKYDDWLSMIQERYPEIADEINRYTGEELTQHDKNCQAVLDRLTDTYDGISEITESGTYTMYDKYNKCWDTITVKTDEATGQIIGIYDNYNGSLGGYTQAICDNMKSQGQQANITADDVSNSFGIMAGATVNASGEIVSANGNIIGSLDNVKNHSDGTKSGIINLNGTPIRINCDKDGAISGMNEVIRKADAIPRKKSMTISAIFQTIGNGIKSLFGFAQGTDNAPPGLATVAEQGPELILNRDKTKAVLATNLSLVKMAGGEQVLTAMETKKALAGKNINGGYFNSDSLLSKQLINNTNNSINNITTNNNNNMNMNLLANVLTNAFTNALLKVNTNTISLNDVAANTGNNFAKIKRGLRY